VADPSVTRPKKVYSLLDNPKVDLQFSNNPIFAA
jgi:hypothetical protein